VRKGPRLVLYEELTGAVWGQAQDKLDSFPSNSRGRTQTEVGCDEGVSKEPTEAPRWGRSGGDPFTKIIGEMGAGLLNEAPKNTQSTTQEEATQKGKIT